MNKFGLFLISTQNEYFLLQGIVMHPIEWLDEEIEKFPQIWERNREVEIIESTSVGKCLRE